MYTYTAKTANLSTCAFYLHSSHLLDSEKLARRAIQYHMYTERADWTCCAAAGVGRMRRGARGTRGRHAAAADSAPHECTFDIDCFLLEFLPPFFLLFHYWFLVSSFVLCFMFLSLPSYNCNPLPGPPDPRARACSHELASTAVNAQQQSPGTP